MTERPPATPPAAVGPQVGLARGTLLVLGAEALAFPAGLIVTILLTRHLTPGEFGALALALAGIAWLEWTVVSLFSRAAFKLVAEAEDWSSAAAAVVRAYAVASVAVAAAVFMAAPTVAVLLNASILAPLLRIFSLEIPLFALAHAYRAVLVGRGMHGSRAAISAGRWAVRALLVAGGVAAGAPIRWIAALIVVATAVEFTIAWVRANLGRERPSGRRPGDEEPDSSLRHPPIRRLLADAAPLAIAAICLRLFDRLDIFALRLLGGSLESVSAYGVAQNLALAPALFGSAFVPGLIAALSYRFARRDFEGASRVAGGGLRASFLVLPAALLLAGSSQGLIGLLFGPRYEAAGPLFSLLVVGATGTLVVAVATAILVAGGRLRWTIALSAPMVAVALLGHLLLVPRYGAVGAAVATAATAWTSAVASCFTVSSLMRVPVPWASLIRGMGAGAVAGWGMWRLSADGWLVVPAVVGLGLLLAGGLALIGELTDRERRTLEGWFSLGPRARGDGL